MVAAPEKVVPMLARGLLVALVPLVAAVCVARAGDAATRGSTSGRGDADPRRARAGPAGRVPGAQR